MRVPRHLRAENLALHYRLLEAQTEASPQSSMVSQSESENFSCLDRTSDDSSHRLRAKKVLFPLLGKFADISYLKEHFKPHLLRDVCTLCFGALVSDSLLHMLL